MIEHGIKYQLVAANGRSFSLNDRTAADFVGFVDTTNGGITGLDAPEIRESFDLIPAGDGARHHNFYRGRRPVVVNAMIDGGVDAVTRNLYLETVEAVVNNALRADARLLWTNSGSAVEKCLWLRAQQPNRETGITPKTFQAQMVSAEPRILSSNQISGSAQGVAPTVALTNEGNAEGTPIFEVHGPITDGSITELSTYKSIRITGHLSAGYAWVIDSASGSVGGYVLPVVLGAGFPWDSYVDPLATDWSIPLLPKPAVTRYMLVGTDTDASTQLIVAARHAWA